MHASFRNKKKVSKVFVIFVLVRAYRDCRFRSFDAVTVVFRTAVFVVFTEVFTASMRTAA